jgi:hydrogenase/urease accessory protein HupE
MPQQRLQTITATAFFFLVLLLAPHQFAMAHPLAPSLLEIRETEPGRVEVLWRTPVAQTAGSRLRPELPSSCRGEEAPVTLQRGTGVEIRWSLRCDDHTIVSKDFGVRGLENSRTSALLRVELANGQLHNRLLSSRNATFRIPEKARPADVLTDYTWLGAEHILSGPDHLLFVLALLLLIRKRTVLLWTISAFTLGHSITLILAVLDVIAIPQAPVEVLIAASVVFLAAELVRSPHAPPSLTERRPWMVAAGFGLLHGLGFAGALTEIGLPKGEIPLALLSFNLGIEFGQLSFIALVLIAAGLWNRIGPRLQPEALGLRGRARTVAGYAIGSVAAYWLFERLNGVAGSAAFFGWTST